MMGMKNEGEWGHKDIGSKTTVFINSPPHCIVFFSLVEDAAAVASRRITLLQRIHASLKWQWQKVYMPWQRKKLTKTSAKPINVMMMNEWMMPMIYNQRKYTLSCVSVVNSARGKERNRERILSYLLRSVTATLWWGHWVDCCGRCWWWWRRLHGQSCRFFGLRLRPWKPAARERSCARVPGFLFSILKHIRWSPHWWMLRDQQQKGFMIQMKSHCMGWGCSSLFLICRTNNKAQ